MRAKDILSAKGLAFIMLFSALVLLADRANFSQILGGANNQSFTFFQFIGPIAGGFLGAGAGVLSVLLAEIISFIWNGKELSAVNILRLLPMLFAALYFAKYSRNRIFGGIVPLICMALFIANPVGQQAWLYSLYWLVPAIALLLPEHLFLRSLGATMTAHSIGSVIWLYTFPSTPEFWMALIPVVAFERLLFALGISGSYVAINTLFSRVEAFAKSRFLSIEEKYVLNTGGMGKKAR